MTAQITDALVEKVARAIANAPWHFGEGWQICADMARAAIEATGYESLRAERDELEAALFRLWLAASILYAHAYNDIAWGMGREILDAELPGWLADVRIDIEQARRLADRARGGE